jgi:hypothetical protein
MLMWYVYLVAHPTNPTKVISLVLFVGIHYNWGELTYLLSGMNHQVYYKS